MPIPIIIPISIPIPISLLPLLLLLDLLPLPILGASLRSGLLQAVPPALSRFSATAYASYLYIVRRILTYFLPFERDYQIYGDIIAFLINTIHSNSI